MQAAPAKSTIDTERVERILAALKGAKKVAILRLGSVGDVLATLPFAWLLRDLLPVGTSLAWIAHAAEAQLLEGVAVLDEILPLPRASMISSVPSWRKKLRGTGIDVVFDLHANVKSAIVSLATGARVRVGLDRADCRERWNPLVTNFKLPRLSSGNKTRRALEIATLLGHGAPAIRFGLEFTPDERRRAAAVLGGFPEEGRPVAVLQLGRFEDVRSWPPENYVALAGELARKGCHVLVLGGPQEVQSGNIVKSHLRTEQPAIRFEVGTLGLREVGALFQALSRDPGKEHVFLGPDSGCLHLSAACGLRTVGLHGPHSPERTAPMGPNVEAIYHPEAADCIPCGRRECVHEVESFCMKSISMGEALERLSKDKAGDRLPPSSLPSEERPMAPSPAKKAPPWKTGEGLQAAILAFLPFFFALSGPRGIAQSLPPALSTGGTVLITYLFGRSLGNHGAGLFSALSLLLMQGFLRSASAALPESVAAFLVTAGLFLYYQMDREREEKPGRGTLGRAAGLPGLGALATGATLPLGGLKAFLLPLAAVITFHAGERSLRRLLEKKAAFFFLLALFLAGAFFLSRSLIGGREAPEAAAWGRSTEADVPSGSYLPWLAIEALPASLLLPLVFFSHLKIRRYREDLGFADRRWRFPKAAFFGGLALLFLLPGRAALDLLLLFPMLSLLTGSWLGRMFFDRVKPW
jgi:ADP-heptose:LPS heptosyltransferase